MTTLDPLVKADLLAAAMEKVGFAIWQVQGLEETAAIYLVIRVQGSKGMGRERARVLMDKASKMTFGTLVRELAQAKVLDPVISARLLAAVNERNWFAHRGRRETRGMFAKPTLYATLMRRAEGLAEEALALNKLLGDEIVQFVLASGVDQEKWARQADALARSWGIQE